MENNNSRTQRGRGCWGQHRYRHLLGVQRGWALRRTSDKAALMAAPWICHQAAKAAQKFRQPTWMDADGTKDQTEVPDEMYHMSCKCYLDKVPQKEWLKQRESLVSVLEATRPRSRCRHGHAPSAGAGERSAPGLSAGIWYFLGLRQYNSGLHKAFSLCAGLSPNLPFV